MLFKRGSTISAAEGGCQAEVGGALLSRRYLAGFRANHMTCSAVACSMASAGFAACMGGMLCFAMLPEMIGV